MICHTAWQWDVTPYDPDAYPRAGQGGPALSIIEDLLDSLCEDAPVRSVLVGVHCTMVCSRYCGLATTIASCSPHGRSSHVRESGALHEKTARDLAEYALSDNPVEACIGVAAINSLLEVDAENAVEINASELLVERGRGRNVALVGHFPFIPRLRESCRNLWVLELRPSGDDYPSSSAPEIIPQADVVALTGSALINHTLDGLLALCSPEALVVILGPSTPLSPVLFEHGVDILAGSRIVDEPAVGRYVGQGASFTQIQGVRKITFSRQDAW